MPNTLWNVLSFTGLVVGVPSVQAHRLNRGGIAVAPEDVRADSAGFTITVDATNVTVVRGASAAASVNVEVEIRHSMIDAQPLPNGVAASNLPFIVQGGGGAAGGITAVSGGTTLATGPQIVFQNGGNVTFGINGNTITASVQTAGGTATGVGFSAGSQSQSTGVIQMLNSNGVTFGMSNSSQVTASFSTLVPSNSNNVSFGINGSTLTASASFPAQTAFVLSNSNGVSFGTNGSTVTASVAAGATATGNLGGVGAAGGTQTSGTVVFSNSNNVTFGYNAGTITATASFSGGGGVAASAGTQSVSTGTLVFANSNGVTFGMSGSSQITASYSQSTAPAALAVNGAGSVTAGTAVFSNSNNITFGINGSTITASAAAGPAAISAAGGSATAGTVVFSNANNVTFGMNASTVTASASFVQTPFGLSAGTQSVSTGTVVFANSNGVTFGMSNSNQITGRVMTMSGTANGEDINILASSAQIIISATNNGSVSVYGQGFTALGVGTVSIGGGQMTIGRPTLGGGLFINGSNGTWSQLSSLKIQTAASQSIAFFNGAGQSRVTVTGNGATGINNLFGALDSLGLISSTGSIALANPTISGFDNGVPPVTVGELATASAQVFRLQLPGALSATRLDIHASQVTTNICSMSISFGVYGINGVSASLLSSASGSIIFTTNPVVGSTGITFPAFPLSAGDYMFALQTATAGAPGDAVSLIGQTQFVAGVSNASTTNYLTLGTITSNISSQSFQASQVRLQAQAGNTAFVPRFALVA